jgi:hypothetical protein
LDWAHLINFIHVYEAINPTKLTMPQAKGKANCKLTP